MAEHRAKHLGPRRKPGLVATPPSLDVEGAFAVLVTALSQRLDLGHRGFVFRDLLLHVHIRILEARQFENVVL